MVAIGITPLHLGAKFGHSRCIQILLDSGADRDIKDDHGRTPLYHASARMLKNSQYTRLYYQVLVTNEQYESCAQVLLDYDVNTQITSNEGQKAFDICTSDRIKKLIFDYDNIPRIKEPDGY